MGWIPTVVGFLVKTLGVDFTLCGFDEKTITFLLPTHIKKNFKKLSNDHVTKHVTLILTFH